MKELQTLKGQLEEKDKLIHSTSASLQETHENLSRMKEEVDLLTAKLEEKEALLNAQIEQLHALGQEVL